MSGNQEEEDPFKRKPRIARSPQEESGLLSDFLNVSKNCKLSDDNNPSVQVKSDTQTSESSERKSVSFQILTTSSTFCIPDDNSIHKLLYFDTQIQHNPEANFDFQFEDSLLDPSTGVKCNVKGNMFRVLLNETQSISFNP